MSNHVDSLFAAVSVLAGSGNIKQRLIQAYEGHLANIDVDDLPLALTQAFADLRDLMSRVEPMNGEGSVCASVRKMSIDEANECAGIMVRLYGDIIRYADNTQELLPLQMGGATVKSVAPPFLVKSSRLRSG
ncbi:MAG: hypothetical protein OEW68_10510 [Gammaproteobacteria bacterium]|nr:hypothetical protein [Gammaproteobacteria bacterium]MDH4315260.1 hypothetical protein [Gammaproteobacteria bacterium]MDH5215368.1 hypothetical protein [Gammaproteobacteria bacterium]MDH5501919.1 hypothetical protein [Gammaproteobacteria bacterium]